jgi:2-keto-4-pentenoate hydratase
METVSLFKYTILLIHQPVLDNDFPMIPEHKAANFLLKHRISKETMENIPDDFYPDSETEAYAIQDVVVENLIEQNNSKTCGYKLACTNRSIMELLNVDGPLSGRIMSHSTHPEDIALVASDFVRRVVELEFVFVMENDAPEIDTPYSADTIKPLIGSFIPGIEIVDYRYDDFTKVGGNALIADNAIHGASILGKPDSVLWKEQDLSQHPVTLYINDQINAQGSGANVLGSPLNVMAWLANHLISRGNHLKTGDIVTTGTACNVYYANTGDRITADYGILGSVSLSFI